MIHAPASPVARKHPNWVSLVADDEKPQPAYAQSPAWPPREFVQKTAAYAQYARPPEPQEAERNAHRATRRISYRARRPSMDFL